MKIPEQWLEKVEQNGAGLAEDVLLTARERGEEIVMTALRLKDGLDKKNFARNSGIPLKNLINQDALGALKEQNLVVETETRLAATRDGALLVNAILGELLA